ncbi:hypothetical protein DOY81_015738, partial [Sarcophaga bullata]
TSALTVLFDIISNAYTSNLITTKIIKIKIDQMIDEIIYQPKIPIDENLTLRQHLDDNTTTVVMEIRKALTILFHFSRKLSPNKDFENDLREWIRKLISLHLRVATKEDHWFILFNILRCPSGVGSWASEFVQIPCNRSLPLAPAKHTNEPPLACEVIGRSTRGVNCMSVILPSCLVR